MSAEPFVRQRVHSPRAETYLSLVAQGTLAGNAVPSCSQLPSAAVYHAPEYLVISHRSALKAQTKSYSLFFFFSLLRYF